MSLDTMAATVTEILADQRHRPGALLPVLHAVQDALGYIPEASVQQIAEGLNLSRAEVHGVITYYHHFRTTPPARHIVHVCRAEACQSMGSEKLAAHIHRQTALKNADAYEVHPVYCLGLCANAPALMLDDQLHARMTTERFDELLRQIQQGEVEA